MNNYIYQGAVIGPYSLESLLGQGGMAQVWKARNGGLHRYEAIKILPPQMTFDRSFVERFLNEARVAANLNHPNIAAIHAVSSDESHPYFAMELVEGGDLADLIAAKGRFSLEEALPILRQIGEALDFAHSSSLIHRDVKPANVMLTTSGQVKMVDFGIARSQEQQGGTRLTQSGMILGTPSYMSPEQGGSGAVVDHRSDIYSLGIIAYEMLCGRPPFIESSQTSAMTVILEHIRTPLPDPQSFNPSLSTTVKNALETVLAKEPSARPGSCAEFLKILQQNIKSSPLPAKPARTSSTSEKKRLSPLPIVAAGIAFMGMALIGIAIGRGGFSDQNSSIQYVTPAPQDDEVEKDPVAGGSSASSNGNSASASLISTPDLLGMRESQARASADSAGLKLTVTTGSSSSVTAGEVMGQDPSPKIAIKRGSQMTVRISTGPDSKSFSASSNRSSNPQPNIAPPPIRRRWPSPDAPRYTYALSESDLIGKSNDELTIMRNTIYARYGRRFRRSDLQQYFSAQNWYYPNPNYHDGLLSAVEKRNAGLILQVQKGSSIGE